jgi:hypothetical protein
MPFKYTPHTEEEAKKLAKKGEPLKEGNYQGTIAAAIEKLTRDTQKEMMEVTLNVDGRDIKDCIVGENDRDAARLLHLCQACGAEVFQRYKSGSLSQSDLPGHRVTVRLSIKRGSKGYPPRNIVDDYEAADSSVVTLRSA